jgi:hypothetical protein
MQRRLFLTIPGVTAAFAASQAFGQVRQKANMAVPPRASRKVLIKHSGSKAFYKVPKNAAKEAKYLSTLTVVLSLNAAQQQQAAAIFTNAANTSTSIHSDLKASRKALVEAIKNNDSGGIAQASMTLGTLTSQCISNGALANAAFFQLLTPDQQAKLCQFQG